MTARTILVVDDFDAMRRFVCRAIEQSGYRALSAANAAEAQEILNSTPIDLLVTDVDMPVVTGVELAAGLVIDRANLPVIFMSGRLASRDLRLAGRPTAFLQKPFTISRLWEEIDRILPGRRVSG